MNFIKKYFEFDKYKTNFKTEIIAGITTFLAMIYIVVVNAKILSQTGMPETALVTSTVIITVFSSIAMGIYSRNPYAVAPAMGMNVFFAYSIVMTMNVEWQVALGIVFWSGVIFVILSLLNIRSKILSSIPKGVKHGIGAGIGIFIALVGFYNAGVIQQSSSGLLEISQITPQVGVFLVCLFLLLALASKKIKASILIVIVLGCILSFPFGRIIGYEVILNIPTHIFSKPDFTLFFSLDIIGSLKLSLVPAIFTFLFINIFDSTGSIIGLAQTSDALSNEKGNPKNMRESLVMDAAAVVFSSICGSSPSNVYVESATGIAVGGRTGLVAIITGILFLPLLFLSNLIVMVPTFVVAPALVLVGCFMISSLKHINWDNMIESAPAFITIIIMPLALSISEGVIWGMISWFVIAMFEREKVSLMSVFITFCCFLMLLESMGAI